MTKNCVKICLENLLTNLKKYPQDKKSIWKCLEGVGRNHSWLILPLVPSLLSQHPFFDTPETDPEDPAYASVLILVLNGAKGCPTMKTLFDEKLIRHYHYLRDTIPQYVPDLSDVLAEAGEATSIATNPNRIEVKAETSNGRILLKELIGKLKNADNLNAAMKLRLHRLILKDLKVRFQQL
jgi:integrator complex subunit 4